MNVQLSSSHFPYDDASLHEIREHLSPDRNTGLAAFSPHRERSAEPGSASSAFGYHDRRSGSASFPANQEYFMHMQRSVEPDQRAISSTFGDHARPSGSTTFPANQEHFMQMQRSVESKKEDKKKKKIMKPDGKKKNIIKFDDDNKKKKIMKLDDDDDNKKKKIMKFDMFVPKGTFLFRLDDLGTSRSALVWCVENHRLIVRYDRVDGDKNIYARSCRYAGWLCLNPEKYAVLDKITLMEDGLVEIELPPVEALEQAYKHMIESQTKDNEELSGEESTSEVCKADGCEEVIVKDEEGESEIEVDAQAEIREIQLETSANDEANETHEGASEGQLV